VERQLERLGCRVRNGIRLCGRRQLSIRHANPRNRGRWRRQERLSLPKTTGSEITGW
jgi:hypothetical protein